MFNKIYILSLIFALFIDNTACPDTVENMACLDFLETTNCTYEHAEKYKLSCASRRYELEVGKTVRYELVFYGGIEIVIQCCTEDDYYPVRFKLIKTENEKVIYDNKYNNYIDNLNLLLDHTELLAVEISLEPKKRRLAKREDEKACIGMAIYTEKTF